MKKCIISILIITSIILGICPSVYAAVPILPSAFLSLDANIGASSHFKPAHQYACMQNPPDFTWPQIDKAYSYDVVVAKDEALTDIVYKKDGIKYAYYNFTYTFEPDTYWWAVRYRTEEGGEASKWSVARRFRIDPSAHEYLVPEDFTTVVEAVPQSHPRIWFTADTIDEFVKLKNGPDGNAAYQRMLNSCNGLMNKSFTQEPEYGDPDAHGKGTNMGYTAQIAALCHILADDPDDKKLYGDYAVEALLEAASWDSVNGGSSFTSHDQAFFELLMRTSMAYDWMYNYMTSDQRTIVQSMLVERFNYLNNVVSNGRGQLGALRREPFNSHLWSYIGYYGITCLALVHDVEGVDDYFKEMLELNSAHLPPMCIEDGGWSKGTHYWNYAFTRDKWFMDTMKYSGYIDYYDKAWARNELKWVLYMFPDNSWGSFGDHSGTAKASGSHVVGLSKLGKFTDDPVAYWLRNKIGNITNQYGTGAFDAILYADTASEVGEPPLDYPNSHLFTDQGMVGMHSSVISSNRTSLYFRSGQYGSYNHMHADQNAFIIEHNGNKLAGKSGFYDSYHSTHDSGFTRQTFAHNSITYNGGYGQKDDSKDANGNIKQFVTHHEFDAVVGDAADAYVGKIDKFDRSIIYLRPDSYIVVDELENNTKQTYEWWLNAPGNTMSVSGTSARVKNNGSVLDVNIVSGNVANGVFSHDYINPADGKEYYPDPESTRLTQEAIDRGFDKVYFKTPAVSDAVIVATMNVNEGSKKTFTKKMGIRHLKLSLKGTDIAVYVCTAPGSEITTDAGYKFNGTALVVSDDSIMLVNGTSLSYGGSDIISKTTEPVTFVAGLGQMSFGANDDVVIKLNKNNAGIKSFLPPTFSQKADEFDLSVITDVNLRPIEKYNGKPHGAMGITADYTDDFFTIYADKGTHMLLTEESSFVNSEQLIPTDVSIKNMQNGKAVLTWEEGKPGNSFDAEINGTVYKGVTSPFEFSYGNASIIDARVRGVGYGMESSWTDRVYAYPEYRPDVSEITFTSGADGDVTAEVTVSNNATTGALMCALVVAAYDKDGNTLGIEQSRTYSLNYNEERTITLAANYADAENYKAFVWNSVGNIHTVARADGGDLFKQDTKASDGLISATVAATDFCDLTNGYLFGNLHGRSEDDYSLVTGSRQACNYAANASQHHEIFKVDESLVGYDYFAFNAGNHTYSKYDSLLTFDIVEDSEVIILATRDTLNFEGYTVESNPKGWLSTRYLNGDYCRAMKALGHSVNYGVAEEYDKVRNTDRCHEFTDKYITEAYEVAPDSQKEVFDNNWNAFTKPNEDQKYIAAVSTSTYVGKYSRVYTLEEGADKLTVTIPRELTGNNSRNLIVVVKPYNSSGNPDSKALIVPLAPAKKFK